MNKVMRFELLPCNKDSDDYSILWKLQNDCAKCANRVVQYNWEWFNFEMEYFKENGTYPDKEVVIQKLGKNNLSCYIYDKLRAEFPYVYTSTISQIVRSVSSKFTAGKRDLLIGNVSIPSFRNTYPIPIVGKIIRLICEHNSKDNSNEYFLQCSVLAKEGCAEYNRHNNVRLKMVVKDGNQKALLKDCTNLQEYITDGTTKTLLNRKDEACDAKYKITTSNLIYNKKKRRWFVNLGYAIENSNTIGLDENRIVGVHLGITNSCFCAVSDSSAFFRIEGSEITAFRNQIESRKEKLQRQTKYSGNGSIGHGVKRRIASIDELSNKISNFRDTCNHKYSRAIVDFAIREKAGIIVIKDMTGISEENTFLKNWSYYDLQQKISNKAKENGIKVVTVAGQYTSRRCSSCGHINDNGHEGAFFVCENCKKRIYAERNSAKNLATKDIDKLIEKKLKSNK